MAIAWLLLFLFFFWSFVVDKVQKGPQRHGLRSYDISSSLQFSKYRLNNQVWHKAGKKKERRKINSKQEVQRGREGEREQKTKM